MSQLAVTVLQFGLLLLLWVLILSIVAAQSRDLMISKRSRAPQDESTRSGQGRRRRRESAAATAGAPAGHGGAAGAGGHSPAASGHPTQAEQAPAASAQRPRPRALVVVEGPATGTEVELGSAPIMLGRAQESTLVLVDDYASGKHARLFPQGSRWFLEDLGSTNGTYIDEQRLTRAVPVDAGRPFRVGKSVLELRS